MKGKFYALALASVLSLGMAVEGRAEINVNINLGPPVIVAPPPRVVRYNYRYYPSWEVYFEPSRGLWFWWEGTIWRNSRERPHHVRYIDRDYVDFDLDGDDPRHHHQDVRKKYPHDYRRDKDRDHDRGRDKDDDRGRGKGRGKD